MQNFRDVAAMADDAGAAQVCETPEALAKAIQSLLEDSAQREQMGEQAKQLVQRNLGASRRYAKVIAEEAVKAK